MSARSRENLRDFQTRLADRLKLAQAAPGNASKLGFMAGGRYWLVSLEQVSEVVTVPALTPVPWAQTWFSGVANVRGVIYGCTDLAAFIGMGAPQAPGETRLLLVNPAMGVNAAWRVERALGLRALDQLEALPADAEAHPWEMGRWRDQDGNTWTEIDFEYLVAQPSFLEAGQ